VTRRLIESCAAVLAPLLPADADRDQFLNMVAVHGDTLAAKRAIEKALRTGVGFDDPYGYSRAFCTCRVRTSSFGCGASARGRLAGLH
jgi:adenine-specific DNA methylase